MAINPFLLISGVSGLIFAIAGFLMLKFPPKKINSLYGYRTKRSMSSQELWDFSQIYSARLMSRSGLLMIGIGLLGQFFQLSEGQASFFGLGILLTMCFMLFWKTEQAMREREE